MRRIFLCFSLLVIVSCTGNKQGDNAAKSEPEKGAFLPPKVTVLADLPDSLQPKTFALDTMPKPRLIAVPTHSGGSYTITDDKGVVQKIKLEPAVRKLLPVLQNEKGIPIKDSAGNTFIMGDGGISNFSTFTTDYGLALDATSCSILDKKGNLWFGTSGGGVSRYDGKSFTTFSTAQGLANNTVWCIIEDKNGNLWFGTDGGVSRYDGESFMTFSTVQGLADNRVRSIAEDKKGNLWLGTDGGGVSRYDPSASPAGSNSFVTFSITQGLANNSVLSIAEDKRGNLWFGTQGGGVSRYDPLASPGGSNSFTTFSTAQGLANNNVRCIAEDKTGNLWFGTDGGGVSRYDPTDSLRTGSKSFVTFSAAQGLANNSVLSIAKDKSGNLWFGTKGGGVSRYDPSAASAGSQAFTTFTTAQGLANNSVWSITEDKTGKLWFCTYGGGVSCYNGKSFTTFSSAQGLADNSVISIAEDKTGNLWFGTYDGGVSCYDRKSFTTFSTAQGLAYNRVYSIAEDKTGNLWFGTQGGGVSRYDGKSFMTFSVAQGLANNNVICIAEDKNGNLWLGTWGGGVSRYDPSATPKDGATSFTTFTTAQGLANNSVFCIYKDNTGNLWFGTQGGVSRYDGKSFMTFTIAQGLASNSVTSIAQDKTGNLWFGTDGGVSVMSEAEVKKLPNLAKVAAGGLSFAKALAGEVWAFFKTFTKTEGLPDNFVTQIMQVPDGKIAIGTNLGIALFTPSEELTKITNIEIYNSNTGCPVKDVNEGQNCMLADRNGIIWAGTGSEKTALVRFDHSVLRGNSDAPTLLIKSIKVNEENVCWQDLIKNSKIKNKKSGERYSTATPAYVTEEVTTLGRSLAERERDSMQHRYADLAFDSITSFYPIPVHLVLPHRYNRITVDFNAVETGKPNLVNYQYMLQGYDNDWSPVLKKTSATFGNIHEGTYIFKVKAQGPNGIWCEPVTYTFKVLPPWYRTWWAYLADVLMVLGGFTVYVRWRTASLRKRQKELEQTVDERTAEVVAEKKEVEKLYNRSEDLLLNILPSEVAEELKAKGSAEAKMIDEVTVLFTDFKGFTQLSEKLTPKALVAEINECFSAFDHIMEKYGVEKIKTIGDSYMAAGGLPTANKTHPEDVVNAALEIQQYMAAHKANKEAAGELYFEIRIGIHSGPVVAGIVGVKKFQYDIWGDTVNTASRMESSGEVGKVNISGTTYELVKDKFTCEYRGEIEAKHKGMMGMYFVSAEASV
jgi:ligand-binding sensor domain-containing protein/class 3 adenylate cyclase